MPGRYYIWAIILLVIQCSSLFDKRSDLEKAIDHYHKTNIEKAVHHFNAYYQKHPTSDTVLYYLHDCYKKMGNNKARIEILERLVALNTHDVQVYVVLYAHYHSMKYYDRLFTMLASAPPSVLKEFDKQYAVTRELYAKLLVGSLNASVAYQDPIAYAVMKNYLPVFLDGMFYREDRITMGNLIIMNDQLIEPSYPGQFYFTRNISDHSFLYLPYMRLIDKKIIPHYEDLDPNAFVPLGLAMYVIRNMKMRGFFD